MYLFIISLYSFFITTYSGDKEKKSKSNEAQQVATTVLAGTDGLGRTLPLYGQVGSPKPEGAAQVAMFYFLWQGDKTSPTSEDHWDLDRMWTLSPEVFEDFNHPGWGGGAGVAGRYYFWGKPVYGYYRGDDYWVHVRNMQLLTDAGVDLLVLDATNRLVYPRQSEALMQAMESLRAQGRKPPRLIYYTNTRSGETMQEIYDLYYKDGAPHRYPNCWYLLEGKPLILGLSKEASGTNYEDFFTIRESQWPNEPTKTNGWSWMEFVRPQHVYSNHKGEREMVNVSVAQHPDLHEAMGGSAFYGREGNWGRSYRNGRPGDPEKDLAYGYNAQEQWDFALRQNVPFIFVTGWNEWIAGKWKSPVAHHALFVDQASPEYSRDIEPSLTAGLEDHYYMQLVANIRRYKGLEENARLSKAVSIRKFSDWESVLPAFHDYTGDNAHRNAPGAETRPEKVYVNETGRNDFDVMKVARDKSDVFFYAKTAAEIAGPRDDTWMRLYLNVDRKHDTGWFGYDYRVVKGSMLQRYRDNRWVEVSKVELKQEGNQLMITIPKSKIPELKRLDLEFKWVDNMQEDHPLDWYVNGDAAPGGRFAFLAQE